ncbi:MAG: radical SAM protein, partial [Thermoguttaceae bacterium]|nr:radical SAM protein [Thermoguttaceae bacterium]
YLPIKCDLMSISPKLSNSIPEGVSEAILKRHNTNRKRIESVRRLIAEHPYQLKFVVDQPEDLLEIEEYLKELGTASPDRVYLMPMAIDADVMNAKAEWIGAYCKGRGYRCCPRMQLVWYGNKRGT